MNIETLDHGRIRVVHGYGALLRENGLDAFDRVMTRQGGRQFRDFPGRRTVRLDLNSLDGRAVRVFLKRYDATYLSRWRRLKRKLGWPGAEDEAWREWEAIRRVRELGMKAALPIAVGQETNRGVVTRSFLITEEIDGAIEGHTFAKGLGWKERRDFFQSLGQLVRRFHGAGLVHKDLYLGHVLVVPNGAVPDLFVIDLQRAVEPCCLRERWLVKDLGALAYSSLRAGATRGDLLGFYRSYLGRVKPRAADQQLARRVIRRVAWLATRRPKHDGDYEPGLGKT